MTITMTTDYLTCGECLREFPLQCITLFIQHKKLDCDDETEEQGRDPKLQCNYCPQGFMTAWALLVHAQLTHNLKLFLEKASRSLGNPVRFSHVDQSGYPNMPLGFSPLNRRFGSSVTTYDATPRDEIVSSLQNKPNENIGTSLTPEKDKTIKQSNTKTDTQSIAANCQQQCKNVSSIVISRNIMTRPRQMGEMTKILECVGPEKNVDSSTNIPVCSNIQICPDQIPVSSNLQINTINTPVCSNIQISPGQIPVCSNIQINPDQIPVCSNLQISTNQIPVCSNLQISPDQIPVCSNLQISTTNTPVCSNIQITPDQIPVCSNIQITPDQIPVGSNIQISPDQIPVCSNLQISPDQIPVCSNLQISPGQIPVCSNLQISPDQIPVCSNLQISPDQIPVCSNLQINPDQIPACSNLQINPDQIPVCSNLQINPDQIPVCSNLQISPDQIPVCSNLQISPDQIPVCSNLQISPDQIPVCSNLQISPDQIPVCSNLQINPDQIPVCSNLQINPDQIPVCSNLQINPDQIPVCSNLQINPDQIPVCSNLQINPDQIPVCSNLQINPDQIPVCSNLQISPDQIPVCSNLLINLGILPITQTSLFPQCSTTPLTMFSDHIASQSSIGILPTVLCRTSFMSQPEPAIKTSAKMTYDAILKQKLSPQAVTTRTSLDNHESSNQSCFLDPATILPNSVTASPHPPSALPRLIVSSSDSSSDIMTSSAVCSSHAPNMDSSVDSTIPLFKLADDRYAKRQRQTREESSNIVPSNYMADIQIENPSGECCGSQGCGVTVIPGSHEDLQKCCNAVVPKKRKRHMEQKHTPFSWSSSRYARRKMLHRSLSSSVARSTTSQYVGKPSAGTIYIDLEPDSLKTTSEGQEGRIFKVTQSASPGVRLIEANDSPVKCSEKPVGQSKPHTMILKPGVVFSIPFTYIIPTSMTSSVTSSLSVSRGSVSFVDSIAQSGQSSSPASNQDQIAADDGNHTNLNMPDIVSYSSTVGDDQVIDPEKIRRHSTPKPFPCEKCAMAFNQRIHLKKHMSKHTGIKPYKCEECNYSTVERSHLKVHIRIHTGEKPFKCTFCEYATAQNSTLKIHLKRHHGGKMFQCQSCEKQFTQAEQLKGHKWEHGLKVVASPEQKAREDVKPGGLGTSPSQSSVPSRLSTRLSQNSSDGQSSNFPTVEVNTSPSTNQQAVSGHVDNLNEESTHWQGEESINQQAVFADVDDMTE